MSTKTMVSALIATVSLAAPFIIWAIVLLGCRNTGGDHRRGPGDPHARPEGSTPPTPPHAYELAGEPGAQAIPSVGT